MTNRTCTYEGCDRKHLAKGFCTGHYQQFLAGRELAPLIRRGTHVRPKNDAGRFWAKVEKTETCWNWTGTSGKYGHGQFKVDGKYTLAYHYAILLETGKPVTEGLMVDHICHNPRCVKTDHLREVTHKQNMEHRNGAHRNSQSGIRGVYPRKGKWRAKLTHNKKRIHLGDFVDIRDAEAAAKAGRAKYFTHSDECGPES